MGLGMKMLKFVFFWRFTKMHCWLLNERQKNGLVGIHTCAGKPKYTQDQIFLLTSLSVRTSIVYRYTNNHTYICNGRIGCSSCSGTWCGCYCCGWDCRWGMRAWRNTKSIKGARKILLWRFFPLRDWEGVPPNSAIFLAGWFSVKGGGDPLFGNEKFRKKQVFLVQKQ